MSRKTKSSGAKERRTFAKPSTQAKILSKSMYNSGLISGLGTSHSYEASLKLAAQWLRSSGRGALHELTPKAAKAYLHERSREVGQKTLDRDRQALQAVLRQIGKLNDKQRLNVIKAEKPQSLRSRNYTPDQVQRIISHQTVRNGFSTELAATAGLRAHELRTLLPASERPMDDRPADPEKFREGVRYTVVGKGGLVREVSLPSHLAAQLETRRLDEPVIVIDRLIHYRSFYDIAGGQAWSQSFSRASNSALGFSNGAHGLRHSYAQDRNREIQARLGEVQRAKAIVSQELGHFRPEITDTYLR
ncbi:site-specific integrase [Pseudomonas rubra]|uniref:Site-specific integrase n=1 Tax=Pseudomonas rubra TaxID=2942627 RepID=A0ABT5PF48_9PSED|nr:site-specific integrase [Pseudomonas rubra]MDD1016949.1 site-specific integrase [Pseudomonas rubra]MDD1041054.1 site-specific integrase [Pseudomonas rubra]MDD1157481.1 site-specific integrase [Pseudomonas rubra]